MESQRRFTDREAARLEMLYARAEYDIQDQIRKYIKSGRAPGTTRNLQRLLNNVQYIRKDLLKGAKTWTETAIPKAYLAGKTWADLGIPEDSPVLPGFFGIHQQAMLQLSQEIYGRLNQVDLTIDQSVRTIARRIDDVYRQVQLEASRGTIAGYRTAKEAAKKIQADLKVKGITGFVDKAGRAWKMSNYAKMAAVTVTNSTFRAGTINRIQERGQDLVIISEHNAPCKACAEYQGKTFSISGTDKEYPPLDQARAGGLFHPRCKHAIALSPVARDRKLAEYKAIIAERERLKASQPEVEPKVAKLLEPKPAATPGFTPAKTEAEARKRLVALANKGVIDPLYNLTPGNRYRHNKDQAPGKVAKMSLELSNLVLQKLEEFEGRCKNLGIPALRAVVREGRSGAAASMGDGMLGLNLKYQESHAIETIAKRIERENEAITSYKERIKQYEDRLTQWHKNPQAWTDPKLLQQETERVKDWIKGLEEAIRSREKDIEGLKSDNWDWFAQNAGQKPQVGTSIFRDGKEKVFSDLEHEFGHHIHMKLDAKRFYSWRESTPTEARIQAIPNKTYPTVYSKKESHYAHEYFAENYSLYMMGQKEHCDPAVIPLIEEIVKRQKGEA